jgi:hypothetical protein
MPSRTQSLQKEREADSYEAMPPICSEDLFSGTIGTRFSAMNSHQYTSRAGRTPRSPVVRATLELVTASSSWHTGMLQIPQTISGNRVPRLSRVEWVPCSTLGLYSPKLHSSTLLGSSTPSRLLIPRADRTAGDGARETSSFRSGRPPKVAQSVRAGPRAESSDALHHRL